MEHVFIGLPVIVDGLTPFIVVEVEQFALVQLSCFNQAILFQKP